MKDKYFLSRRRDFDRLKKNRERESEIKSRRICKFCGRVYRFEKGKCLVWGVKCIKCGGRNYFEA